MATLGGRAIGFSSFPSSSSYLRWNSRATSSSFSFTLSMQMVSKSMISRKCVACSAVQESSSPTATAETKATTPAEAKPSPTSETKATGAGEKEEVKAAPKAAPARPKPAAKAPAKPLPELMAEDVIPSLKTTLEAQVDLSEIELSFQDNKLEGSFLKEGCPYSFWAFFPNGVLTGPKGFSLSSYGSGASTVEPFLNDEKKITAKHVVFWVEKRLAAQGIIPVWKE
ncbi:Glyceraldehyde-3-phosphate dehydrogenase A [Theobroma cacao]|uniref:Glyceraldehyde-3-phosphate dehydrogenase A n=1 Tax=Theobroma cacao TaxID=3641 RepID=A0A061DNK7_THECC|nr:Glyceraldehyde-3-phosphate dehydrogenase A [Theobroma cacao]